MIGLKRASLILTLMWALCGEQAECAGLTFSIDDGPVPHDFGHRVDGVSDGITTNGGLTPNVVILYGDGVLRPLIASSGFGGSVLRINDEADGIVEVRFISEEGVDVRLLSFNVVSRAGIFDEDPIVDRIEIVDERADRVLFSEDNVRVPRGGQRMFEFLNSEDAVEGSDLLLRLDANSLSAAAINLGLDDIVFAQDPPPPGSAPTVRGSVEFPSGDASFADRVVALESDNGLTIAEDGGRVLGPPDDHTLELGDGGRLVVEFVDNVLTVSGDDQADLAIFGTSQSLVPINVAVSSDGVLWLPLGMVDGGGERGVQIDLDAVDIENDSGFRFVEIVDIADDASSAEIDAVGAIFTQRRQGGVGATFENPRGGDGFVVTGVGTSFFTWGVKVSTPFPNSLQFLPGGYSGGVETEFDVGTLTYYNGSTAPGTTVDLVTLRLSLDTGGGNDVSVFEFPLELNSTPNEGSAFENADIVRLPNVFSDVPIIRDGQAYRLRLFFGESTTGGLTEVDRFFAFEGETVSAVLRGVLTATSPLDGCQPQRLTFDHGNEMKPSWDPEGNTIAFATNRMGGNDIGGVQVDRTRERVMATGRNANNGSLVAGVLSWHKPSSRLLTTETVGVREVLAIDVSGSRVDRELIDGSEGGGAFLRQLRFLASGGFFVVSRDGSTALWRRWDGARMTLRSAAYSMLNGQLASATGAVVRERAGLGNLVGIHSAALSPTGIFSVVSELVDGRGYDLFRVVLDGDDEATTLTTTGMEEGALNQFPTISPDGRRVAFSRAADAGSARDIFIMDLVTGEVSNFTMTPEFDETQPDWSPDGNTLVYSRFDKAGSPELRTMEPPNWNLYVQCIDEFPDLNLLKAAFGIDPDATGNASFSEPFLVLRDGELHFGITFSVPVNGELVSGGAWQAGGFEYAVEISDDLQRWERGTEDSVVVELAPDEAETKVGRELLTVVLVDPATDQRTSFMRLAVRRLE